MYVCRRKERQRGRGVERDEEEEEEEEERERGERERRERRRREGNKRVWRGGKRARYSGTWAWQRRRKNHMMRASEKISHHVSAKASTAATESRFTEERRAD